MAEDRSWMYKRVVNGYMSDEYLHGVKSFMKAALIGTVSDFPAYGMLSGWSTHGKLACPICMEDTKSFKLEVGGKPCWFDCHRPFLPKRHPFRHDKKKFTKDIEEKDGPPNYRSSLDVYNWIKSNIRDVVSQAVTIAVRDVRKELGTRIQSLEQIVDKPNTESHAHVVGEPPSSAVPEFLQALTMDGFNRLEEPPRQPERSRESDDLWHF